MPARIILYILLLIIAAISFAQEKPLENNGGELVYVFDIDTDIMPSSWRTTQKAFAEARKLNADYIVIELNTYGGMLVSADSIRSKILRSDIPTLVYITDNAASAGALISIACDKIYMAPGAKIGAASVVDGEGNLMPEKYQSYMRAIMRATAEANGRDPLIAEGMVDPDVEIDTITPKGKIISFTTKEAIKFGYCDGMANTVKEVLEIHGVKNYSIKEYKPGTLDGIINFLTHPTVSGLLIVVIMGGIYFELQTPGVGFPLGAAVLAAILYFAPLYVENLAQSWEIVIFVIGVILLGVEIFVLPGFGVAGIIGLVLILTGLTLSLVPNYNFDFRFTPPAAIGQATLTVFISFIAAFSLMFAFGGRVLGSKYFQRLVLNTTLNTKEAYTQIIENKTTLVGAEGVAVTDLRPAGRANINGEIYDVVSEGGFVPGKTPVKVVEDYRTRIVVSPIENT